MLNIDNFNYESPLTILFQRVSVIVTDLLLLYGVQEVSNIFHKTYHESLVFGFLSLCNIGLLLVDHIHFQYNGILTGILLLSIANVMKSNIHVLAGATWFAILLNLKHIYLYIAPSFIVWLLKWYCLRSNQFFTRLIQLGIIVLAVTAISFGPFIHQLPQVLSRLFPFKRGLVHAYWAANVWSLYVGLDKILTVVWKQLGWLSSMHVQTATMTGGLVQESSLTVLASPTPLVTFIATICSMLPALIILFSKKRENLKKENMVRCLVICALSSFMFGWHVHEKAILTAIIPLGILATTNKADAKLFLLLSSTGHAAILPLLFPENLIIFKIGILVMYIMTVFLCLKNLFHSSLLYIHEWIYVLILPLISLYETVFHTICFGKKLPFFPLALTSCYCSIGILYCWIIYYYTYYTDYQLEKVRLEKKD
ncbi:probable dolichyl pyrophosphate Glc1Man9GlcNAc2 alpha-1,3-glucosyltransferase isoform X2 [Chelonus insularis]|nr:probable dolichyl pyrophosphate Glc1Man9GlcNAc2 alpha-1,3-glucosyltransferase isoform X2 [Chelonus insularis]